MYTYLKFGLPRVMPLGMEEVEFVTVILLVEIIKAILNYNCSDQVGIQYKLKQQPKSSF